MIASYLSLCEALAGLCKRFNGTYTIVYYDPDLNEEVNP